MEDKQHTIFNFSFDETSKEEMKGISQWGKINAVISLVMLLLNIIQFIMASGSAYRRSPAIFSGFQGNNGLTLMIQVVVSVLLNVTLYTASVQMRRAIDDLNPGLMTRSLSGLRNYYKIYGIVLIVCLILGLLAVLFISSYRRY